MNNYVCNIDGKKFRIASESSGFVKVNNKSVNVEINKISEYNYNVKVAGKTYLITTTKVDDVKRIFLINGHQYEGEIRTELEEKVNEIAKEISAKSGGGIIKSPMPGLILKINKQVGDSVEVGESLVLLEAMKMENDLKATAKGIVKEISVKVGDSVEKNETLIILE